MLAADVTSTVVWEHSAMTDGVPSYMGISNNCRNMAIGTFEGSNMIAVATREGSASVVLVNDNDGTLSTKLDMTGISGGKFVINDVQITKDGKILVCNMVMSPTDDGNNHLKVYRWDNSKSAPTIAIDYVLTDKSRYGDEFTVTGSIDDGSAKAYFCSTALVNGGAKILCFSMIPDTNNAGKYIFNNTPELFGTIVPKGSAAPAMGSLAFLPNGKAIFLGSGSSEVARLINADGTDSGKSIISSLVSGFHTSPAYLCTDAEGYDYVGFLSYSDTQQFANVNKFKNDEIDKTERAFLTPIIGNKTPNLNGTGGVEGRVENNNLYVYVMMSNNGIAKYKIDNLNLSGVNSVTEDNAIKIYAKDGYVNVTGIETPNVDVYNVIGQKIVSVNQCNQVNMQGFKGIYIVVVKDGSKKINTSKVIL